MYRRRMPGPAFDLDLFLSMPRLSGLALWPAGDRLVTEVATIGPDGKKFVSALWEVDPTGSREARRLTWSAEGESLVGFRPDGSLLFTSCRKDPVAKPGSDGDDPVAALWTLPAGGGEASLLQTTPAGIGAAAIAREAGTVVYATEAFPGTTTFTE